MQIARRERLGRFVVDFWPVLQASRLDKRGAA